MVRHGIMWGSVAGEAWYLVGYGSWSDMVSGGVQ